MKIEVGKSYRTVEGKKAEIDDHHPDVEDGFQFSGTVASGSWWWNAEGESQFGGANTLVAEWTDAEPVPPCGGEVPTGPTRTVTRLEVVPGVYDGVQVGESDGKMVRVSLIDGVLTANELDAAAAVLTELAKAVRTDV